MAHGHTDWSYEDITDWGDGPTVSAHRLHEHPTFALDALAELLDRVPREIVHPYTMGTDPARPADWRRGSVTDLPGAQLIETVEHGRLWLNVVGVAQHDPTIGALVTELMDEVSGLTGQRFRALKATLLISSPTAQVYYHADNQPNALWHLRGTKRVLVYPQGPHFISDESLEAIVAGASDEQLPYRSEFDAHARQFRLEPGQVAWWPQSSPHRVENLGGLNLSLSVEHRTADSTRREQIVAGNHFLRHRLGRTSSTRDRGLVTTGKVTATRVARRLLQPQHASAGPQPSFTIDPGAPDGVRTLR